MAVIELVGVCKSYRRGSERISAVNHITLSIEEGDFVAIVGPSGSGKTTLLNLIGCVDKPDSGVVRIDGNEINGLSERELTKIRARKIGFVFQQFFLLPTLTALENVQLPALFLRNGDQAPRADELIEHVHLSGRANHLPAQLSGEMQRVAIARALINQPKILLADEPTGNLDSHNAQTVLEIFRELNAGGLLIKGGKYLESLARADVLLIDKTGTLTLGRPQVTDIFPLNNASEEEVLALAASAERYSEHPLAEAVRAAARERGLPLEEPEQFEALPGLGILANSSRLLRQR